MQKALTHCCPRCDWQQTSVLSGAESALHERFDHCPRCLLIRQAARLETIAASAARLSTTITYR